MRPAKKSRIYSIGCRGDGSNRFSAIGGSTNFGSALLKIDHIALRPLSEGLCSLSQAL